MVEGLLEVERGTWEKAEKELAEVKMERALWEDCYSREVEVERKRAVGSQVRWMGLRQREYEGTQDIDRGDEQARVVGKDSKPLGRQVWQTG